MIVFRQISRTIKRQYDSWQTIQQNFFTTRKKDAELFFGDVANTRTPFTSEQEANIERHTNLKANINEIYPIVTTLKSILTKFKPSHKIISRHRDQESEDFATAINGFKHDILYNSRANKRMKSSIKDGLLLGQAIIGVVEEDFYRDGYLNISIDTFHPESFIFDINCRDETMEAQIGYFVEEEMTIDEAQKRFGGVLKRMNQKFADGLLEPSNNVTGPLTFEFFSRTAGNKIFKRNRVEGTEQIRTLWVRSFYEKIFTTMYFVPSENRLERVFLENLDTEEQRQEVIEKAIDTEEDIYVKEHLYFGNYEVEIICRPTTTYIHKVWFFEWAGKPYQVYGVVHFIKENQITLHSMLQQMLLNAQLINGARWTSPKGGISTGDMSLWESSLADPTKVLFWNPIPMEGEVLKPVKEEIGQLGNHFPYIYELIKAGMKSTVGVTDIIQGNPESLKGETLGGLKQFQNSAMERIRDIFDDIQDWSERIGLTVKDLIIGAIQPGMEYIYQLDQSQEQEGEFATFKGSSDFIKKLKLGKYSLITTPQEAFPAEKLAMAEAAMKIAQTTTDPNTRNEYFLSGLKLSGDNNAKAIAKRLDTVKNLTGIVKEKEEIIERNNDLLKQFENKMLNFRQEAEYYKRLNRTIEKIVRAEEKAISDADMQEFKNFVELMEEKKKAKSS